MGSAGLAVFIEEKKIKRLLPLRSLATDGIAYAFS